MMKFQSYIWKHKGTQWTHKIDDKVIGISTNQDQQDK